jgi:hypothetical protein
MAVDYKVVPLRVRPRWKRVLRTPIMLWRYRDLPWGIAWRLAWFVIRYKDGQ